ncbi:MAG: iron-sulfur cluster assembly scaffold protein [Candidatus Limnocylindria bacterium]|nr:iron-sulfur cluster assembly scaffold protein [Candidatus Limnocylindria bacterium]
MSSGTGRYANPRDGDVVEFEVDVTHETIAVTRMELRCCPAATRAANALSRWSHGKTPEDAARIEPRELIERLLLSEDEERCALTVIAALRAALVDAHVKELP